MRRLASARCLRALDVSPPARSTLVSNEGDAPAVFEITRSARTVRFADETVAGVALDRGYWRLATTPGARRPVRELELVLVRGNAERLYELAMAIVREVPSVRLLHGTEGTARHDPVARTAARRARRVVVAPDATLARLVRDAGAECLAQIGGNVAGSRDGDEESLHQLRIGVRRLRTVLRINRKAGLTPLPEPLRARLRRVWALLGEARDWDVFASETWPAARRTEELSGDCESFDRAVATLRAASHAKVRGALEGKRFDLFMLGLQSFIAKRYESAPATARGRKLIGRWLTKRSAKVMRRGRRIEALADDRLHALRIAVKSLRYLAEFFSVLYDRHASDFYLERVAGVQAALGELNDIAVSRRLADQIQAHLHRCDSPRDRLRRHGEIREVRLRRRLVCEWKKLGKSRPFWV
jgi:CHAD domain-containing protein